MVEVVEIKFAFATTKIILEKKLLVNQKKTII